MNGCNHHRLADTVLPDGWFETSIGAHFEFKNGLNKARKFFGHGTPIVNYMDVYRHPWLLPSHVSGKVDVTKNEQQAYSARQHDAFFTRTSETVDEIGMCAVLMEPIENAVFSGFVLRARPLNDKLSSSFAAYALRGRTIRQQIESSATYTTRALTNGKSLSAVIFALPPPKEQELISAALKDIDDLIASVDALIAKKRDIKQAAMQRLLTGKARLPGFEGEWETRPLSEGVVLVSGHHVLAQYCNDRGIGVPYLTGPSDFPEGRISHSKYTTRPTSMCRPQDILITVKGSGVGSLAISDGDYCISRQLMAVRVTGWNAKFIYYLLAHDTSQISDAATGLIPGLSRNDILTKRVALPAIPEQGAIAKALDDLDSEIASLEASMVKNCDIRRAMMQQLLTGRIRLV